MIITKQEVCPFCKAEIKFETDDQAGKKELIKADRQIEKFKKLHEGCKK